VLAHDDKVAAAIGLDLQDGGGGVATLDEQGPAAVGQAGGASHFAHARDRGLAGLATVMVHHVAGYACVMQHAFEGHVEHVQQQDLGSRGHGPRVAHG
jgi:hypothetical protein